MPETTTTQIDLKSALEQYKRNEISVDQFQAILHENGMKVSFWNPAKDPHPATVGNNLSRIGFKYDPVHPKGKLFQWVIKRIFISAIENGHSLWLKKYDKDAFVYDDVRLQQLETFIKSYIKEFCSENGAFDHRKEKLSFMIVDIVLGLCKEDIYYRARLFDFVNKFCGKQVFELAEVEKANIEAWK